MNTKLGQFFCKDINASVTPTTCTARKKHVETVKENQLSLLYLSCKACNHPGKKK